MNNIAAGIIITIISFKLENDVLRELIRYLNIKRDIILGFSLSS